MKEEIKKELEKIAPPLVDIGNDNPFVVPNGYFNECADQVFKKLGLEDDQFIPPSYFEELPDKVLSKANAETKVIAFRYKKWLSIAAVMMLGLFGLYSVLEGDSGQDEGFYANEIDLEESLDYLIENDEIYVTDLIDYMSDEMIEELTTTEEEIESEDPFLEDLIFELGSEELEELL